MKKLILNVILISLPLFSFGQTIRLDSCQAKARANYPLVQQYGLIEKTAQYNLANANKGYLPQFNASIRATYQSDVTAIPTMLEDVLSNVAGHEVKFQSLSKDQYQATLELNQVLWDGGMISASKKNIKAATETEKHKLEVDLYTLNERVNNLFFGILLINEQLTQLNILQDELARNYKRVEAFKLNGVAQQSDLDLIKVEQINATQRESDLNSARKTYVQLLSAFIGSNLVENIQLEKPVLPALKDGDDNKRPEIQMFESQISLFESQKASVFSSNLPKLGLFVKGGYGKPGLNMFAGSFSPYYIGGLNLSWNISGLYSQKTTINKLEVNKKTVQVQKETFMFNTNLMAKQQQNEIDKLKMMLKSDTEIITLRNNIKKSAEAKLTNGTYTVTDLLREINSENVAKQAKALHEIQLYMTVYQLKNTTNN